MLGNSILLSSAPEKEGFDKVAVCMSVFNVQTTEPLKLIIIGYS